MVGEIKIKPNRYYVQTFHFDSAKPCYCKSGRDFGACCAMSSANRDSPSGIHIIKGYLPESKCKQFVRFAKKQKKSWLTINDADQSTDKKRVAKRDPSRVTQQVDLGKKQDLVNKWFREGCAKNIQASKVGRPQWFEPGQLLRYGPGGKYHLHADAEEVDPHVDRWYRVLDRDFSMLIYLNSDYEGGELRFPYLNYTYKPEVGDLVFFPSHHIFSHESLPITSGAKYALVSWGALFGTVRLTSGPAFNTIPM